MAPPRPRAPWTAMPALAALLALSGLLGGCAFIGVMVHKLAPPPKVPAQHTLPRDQVALVFPDDPGYTLSYPPVKGMLAEKLNRQLEQRKLVAGTVSHHRLLDLQAREAQFNRLRVSEVGSRLGAATVIYTEILSFQTRDDPGNPLWRGQFQVRVRVVDSASGEQVWPSDGSKGVPVAVATPFEENSSPDYETRLTDQLVTKMADRVAKLFYKHEAPQPDLDMTLD